MRTDGQAGLYAQLERYIEKHADEVKTQADAERLVEAFMAAHHARRDAAAGLVSRAEAAERRGDRAGAEQKTAEALSAAPGDAGALLLQAKLGAADDDDLCGRLQAAEASARAALTERGFFDPAYEGAFWQTPETRDYIRLRRALLDALVRCGRLRPAVREGEALLRLCEEDGPGVRYVLMHVHAMLEEPEPMERLHAAYDGYEETGMLLPLSVVYYRVGDTARSADCLRRLAAVNPGTQAFIQLLCRGDVPPETEDVPARPFTLAELCADLRAWPVFYRMARGWALFARKLAESGEKGTGM